MGRKKILILGAAAVLALAAVSVTSISCNSMAGRYIGYRLAPDNVETKGRILAELPPGVTLEGQVEIYLDDYSVPHIRADNEHDLYFSLGYMQARDRRFQLEMFKMLSHGRLRELIGDRDPTGVLKRTEIMSRALGFYRDGEEMWRRASQRERELLSAFADGVNAANESEPLPMEFRVLDYSPEPWEPQDTLVVIAMNAFGLCKNWEHELARLELTMHQLRTGGSIDRALEIFPPWFEWPPYLYDKTADEAADSRALHTRPSDLRSLPPAAPELAAYLEYFARTHPYDDQDARENSAPAKKEHDTSGTPDWKISLQFLEHFLTGEAASNNWSVGGSWTGTGAGALASDPHMPHMLPSMGYLFHLELKNDDGVSSHGEARAGRKDAPPESYRVVGGTFLGLPGIAFGTNGRVAWGVTSNWADVTDLYVEKPVPGREGYYHYKDRQLPFDVRTEVFKVRRDDGGFDTEELIIRSTVHGVIVNDFIERIGDGFPLLALQRNRRFGKPVAALLELYGAENVDEAGDAIEKAYVFTGHWAVADDEGNAGYVGSVNLPERTSHLGTYPSPGWTGEYDWEKRVPPFRLPRIINPEDGIIATANQQVYPPFSFPFPVNLEGGTPFRYRRITDLLHERRAAPDRSDSSTRSRPSPRSGQADENPGPPGGNELEDASGVSDVAQILASIQTDGVFLGWETVRSRFTRALVPLLDSSDPLIAEASEVLLNWDGECGTSENGPCAAAPALYNSLAAFAFRNAMADELTKESLDFYLFYYNITPFLYNLLLTPNNPAWDDRRTEVRETYTEALQQAFHDAVSVLRNEYGENIREWTWSRVAPFILKHPFGEVGALAGYLNRGPLGTDGMAGTVYAHQYELTELCAFPIKGGPILRIAVDLNDLPGSVMSLPGGISGRPASRHYDDMLPLFLTGTGVSMEMDFGRIRRRAAGEIVFVQTDYP